MDKRWGFFSVDIELSGVCEQQCRMCPKEHIQRSHRFLAAKHFSTIVQKLAQIPTRISLSGMGDVLLHPDWKQFVDLAKRSNLRCGMVVNAASISPEIIETLLDVRPSFVEVSFMSLRKPLFEYLNPKADYHKSMERVSLLLDAANGIFPVYMIGLLTGYNMDEAQDYVDFWNKRHTVARVFECHSRGGYLRDAAQISTTRSGGTHCGLFLRHAFIDCDGDILACCHDLGKKTAMANVIRDELDDILAKKMAYMELERLPWNICAHCDEPARYHFFERERPFSRSTSSASRFLRSMAKRQKA